MLREIRKGMKPFMWVIVVAFVGGIFLWGAQAGIKALKEKKANEVAKAGDYTIENEEFMYAFQREYTMRMKYVEEQYQGNVPPDVEEKVRIQSANTALEMLIGEYLLLTEAKEKDIVITDEEIRETIINNPTFQRDGTFDSRIYETLVGQELFMTPSEFEDMLRRQLANTKLMNILTSNVRYSDEDIRRIYKRNYLQADLTYIPFELTDYLTRVDEGDIDVEGYYNENKERFKKPRRARIKYIKVDIEEMSEQVEITENEIREYYEEHKMEYLDAGLLHLREILIRVPEDADEATVMAAKSKAEKAISELDAGVDFDEVVQKYSDANSVVNNGDLGFIDPGMKGEEFAKASYNLVENTYTEEPVRGKEGFYVIYREDDIPPYEWSKDKIKVKLASQMAEQLARMKVEDIHNSLSEGKPIEVIGKEMDLEVKSSEYFTEEGTIPGLGRLPDVAIKAFQLEVGETGDIVPVYVSAIYPEPILTGYMVYIVSEKVPAGVPQLSEIKEEVKGDARRSRALELAEKDADEIYEKIKSTNSSIESIASTEGLDLQQAKDITLMAGNDKIGSSYQMMNWLENAEVGDISEPILTKKGAFIMKLDRVDDFSKEEYQSKMSEIRENLIMSLSQAIYYDYYFKRRKDVEVSLDIEEFLMGVTEEKAIYEQKMKDLMEKEKEKNQ